MVSSRRRILFLLLTLPLRRRHKNSAAAAHIATEFLYPNFTASSINFIEKGGIFLTSISSTFSATLSSDSPQSNFIFSILHSPTSTLVWSANRDISAPYTAVLSLSTAGLSISLPNGSILWSTPVLSQHAAALQLLDTGNLLLLDAANFSLWQSFDHPTDTLLSHQRLPAGSTLSTSAGDYRLLINIEDAVLLWSDGDQQYWRLSADPQWVKDINDPIAYMAANESGPVYLVDLPVTKLKFIRLESNGQLRVMGYNGNGSVLSKQLLAPRGVCDLPLSCGELDVCTVTSIGATCNCPASLTELPTGGCSPADSFTLAYPSKCAGEKNQSEAAYLSLGSQTDYFANKFASPASSGGNLSSCRNLCSVNCFCLGFFYRDSSNSCFLIKDKIGSFISTRDHGFVDDGEGYIKILASTQPQHDSSKNSNLFPILLPSIAGILFLVILLAGFYCLRRHHQRSRNNNSGPLKEIYAGGQNNPWSQLTDNHSSTEDILNSDEISIPGLPHRFTYTELVAATNNFSTKIGSGGFGEVFLGELPDKTTVAVKRISAGDAGSLHGKKEFCMEIAVIGSIHHINLVRLHGFSAEGRRRRLLVYEYMNRGSLDRSLFRPGCPVLEWQERMDIAIGAARGLAYLHSGCDRKIVHCDVKPENILLHGITGVKISDFGLAKFMNPEQSGLFTTMRGTRGYLAPEWLANAAISDRADVYSYGMVLLEIIRGKKNFSVEGRGSEGWSSKNSVEGEMVCFPLVALEMHEKGKYLELADERLEKRVREEEVERAVRVALCCLHEEPALRPSMTAVAAMLDGSREVAQPRPEALAFLRLLYGRGFGGQGSEGGNMNGWEGDVKGLSCPHVGL
ncbi:G-type lectin S-receptor-like serine/threonine-protein kinase At5g35370 [Phalaenopsis equestris]|uniref:G-type lectin S-receptor-like serine/threonine-protein kinase At5g35370 n=1 Tax=Phalaenopsis equestris TaxID=78828 RepID=UPI0009E1B8DE|nr:G-type lectin S-receptor-like serine/threonine-protein kinase At5g35370 [Phalaenopsis equestris]